METISKQKKMLELFENSQGDLGSMLREIDKKLAQQRNIFNVDIKALQKEITSLKTRAKRVEIDTEDHSTKIKFHEE